MPETAKELKDQIENIDKKRENVSQQLSELVSPRGSDRRGPSSAKRGASTRLDDKEKKRTKRLFGALVMGTLEKTRKDLDKSAHTEQGKKRAELEAKVAAKERAEREERREFRRKEYLERREEEFKLRALQMKEQSAKELELLSAKWEAHRTNLCKFVRTKADPPIFWRPAKPLEGMEALLDAQLVSLNKEAEEHKLGQERRYLNGTEKQKEGADDKEEKGSDQDESDNHKEKDSDTEEDKSEEEAAEA